VKWVELQGNLRDEGGYLEQEKGRSGEHENQKLTLSDESLGSKRD